MRELRYVFPKTIPVLLGYVFLGITYGILMSANGFPIWLPVLTAALIYTGSMEFLMVSILLSAFHPFVAFLTALMVGARHLFYGIAMLSRYQGSGRFKGYLIFTTSDETFAINYNLIVPEGLIRSRCYFLVSLLDQLYWICGTALGGVFGSLIHFNTEGLDFVMTAMFLTIFANQWIQDREAGASHVPEWIGVGASAICLFLFGPEHFLIPSMIGILLCLTIARGKLERKNETDATPEEREQNGEDERLSLSEKESVCDKAGKNQEEQEGSE